MMHKLTRKFLLLLLFCCQNTVSYVQEADLPTRMQSRGGAQIETSELFHGNMRGDSLPIYFLSQNLPVSIFTIGVNDLLVGGNSGLNLSGKDVPLMIIDAGIPRTTHQEFQDRIVVKEPFPEISQHASQVTSALLGAGLDPLAKGTAPGAKALVYDWKNYLRELEVEANQGVVLANISWGEATGWLRLGDSYIWWGDETISTAEDYKFGFYSHQAQVIDDLVHRYPQFTLVVAAGNDRLDTGPPLGTSHLIFRGNSWMSTDTPRPRDGPYDCLSPIAVPKNVLTVGAIEGLPFGYESAAGVTMSSFSSFGPTDDGRIKPEICANGLGVYTATSQTDDGYGYSTGSSLSAPAVSGAIALLQELYKKREGHYLNAASIKALLIHTANDAGYHEGPDYRFGYGVMDAIGAAEVINASGTRTDTIIETHLEEGQAYELPLFSDGNRPLTISISWTDPKGEESLPSLDPEVSRLVNDLDIRLINQQTGEIQYPYFLDPEHPVQSAQKGNNFRDNSEKVFLETPSSGIYLIEVRHKDHLQEGRQAFSLVISGASTSVSCGTIADFHVAQSEICEGTNLNFENLSEGANHFQWTIDGVLKSTTEDFNYIFKEVGTINVKLTASSSTCFSSEVQKIEVKPNPVVQFRQNQQGFSVDFEMVNVESGTNYNWRFGNGEQQEGETAQHTYDNEGIYEVCVEAQGSCQQETCLPLGITESSTCRREIDSLALVAFYHAAGVSQSLVNWDLATTIDQWEGVHLDASGCEVVMLRLKNKGLSGFIPQEIMMMQSLREIYLRGMEMSTREIPGYIWLLPNLAVLELQNCNLSGTLSSQVSNARKLRQLVLDGNDFQGTLPEEIFELLEMRFFSVLGNQFSGSISPRIGNWTKLNYLNLFENNFTGEIPITMDACRELTTMILARNPLGGSIPDALYECRELRQLHLYNTFIGGQLKELISNWSHLEQLRAFNTLLEGPIPTSTGDIEPLRILHLDNTNINGSIPTAVNNLTKLVSVRLGKTELSGQIPAFSAAVNLEELRLPKANFSGEIPLSLFQKPFIKEITLDHNRFTFGDLSAIVESPWVDSIDVFTYSLQASLPIFQKGDTLYISAGGRYDDNEYFWYRNGQLITEENGDSLLIVREEGAYHCVIVNNSITQPDNWYSNLVLRSESNSPNSCDQDCVFPGDVNNDGTVNMIDLLGLGRRIGESGPPREDQGLEWGAKRADFWNTTTEVGSNEFDNRYLDTNGDGLISIHDTLAIGLNWGQVHDQATSISDEIDLTNQLSLISQFEPIQTQGNGGRLGVNFLLEAETPVQGIAFSIDYGAFGNGASGINITPCLAEDSYLQLVKHDTLNQKLEIGIVSVDGHLNECPSEQLTELFIVMDDLVVIDTTKLFYIKQATFMLPDGQLVREVPVQANAIEDLVITKEIPAGAAYLPVRIYPNPVEEAVYINWPSTINQTFAVTIYTANGEPIFQNAEMQNTAKVWTQDFPPGIYFLQGHSDEHWFNGKFIKF